MNIISIIFYFHVYPFFLTEVHISANFSSSAYLLFLLFSSLNLISVPFHSHPSTSSTLSLSLSFSHSYSLCLFLLFSPSFPLSFSLLISQSRSITSLLPSQRHFSFPPPSPHHHLPSCLLLPYSSLIFRIHLLFPSPAFPFLFFPIFIIPFPFPLFLFICPRPMSIFSRFSSFFFISHISCPVTPSTSIP